MGRIIVRSLGPVRGPWREAAEDYLARLRPRLPITWEERSEVHAPPRAGAADEAKVRAKEAERLLRDLPQGAGVWALDAAGKERTSEEFAELLAGWRAGQEATCIVIGGHLGLDPALRASSERLSLSRLTFSHLMVPAILFEQIYRAQTILDGGPYHR